MDKIEGNYLAQDGNDFPLDCETFDNIQKNSHMAEILGNIGGPKLFLTGCRKSRNSYSAGYVFVKTTEYPDGEVLRWPGGEVTNNTVYVSTTNTPVTANGTTYPAAYTTRVLTATDPGDGADSFDFSEFVHVDDNKPVYGEIKMFAGPVEKIPENYKLCDGSKLKKDEYPLLYAVIGDMYNEGPSVYGIIDLSPNYGAPDERYFRLPDLRGRFIVGYSSVNFEILGNINYPMVTAGGKNNVKLTSSECALPSHSHGFWMNIKGNGDHFHGTWGEGFGEGQTPYGLYDSVNNTYWGSAGGADTDNFTYRTSTNGYHTHSVEFGMFTEEKGNADDAHENRPPYYVMAYIIRVK